SLDAGAPPGATITTAGDFAWTPDESQGGTTNFLTIRVSDGVTNVAETISVIVSEVNSAPVLAPIALQAVTEGRTLTFTATATDTDAPPQKLVFSLEPGAPSGAGINLTNGVFTWACPSDQTP